MLFNRRLAYKWPAPELTWRLPKRKKAPQQSRGFLSNAKGRARTADTGLFRAVLYLLSYLRTLVVTEEQRSA